MSDTFIAAKPKPGPKPPPDGEQEGAEEIKRGPGRPRTVGLEPFSTMCEIVGLLKKCHPGDRRQIISTLSILID